MVSAFAMSWPLCFGILNASLLKFSNRCHFHFVSSFDMLLHSNETPWCIHSGVACVAADINSLFKSACVNWFFFRSLSLFLPPSHFRSSIENVFIYTLTHEKHTCLLYSEKQCSFARYRKVHCCRARPNVHRMLEFVIRQIVNAAHKQIYAFHLYLQWHSSKNVWPERTNKRITIAHFSVDLSFDCAYQIKRSTSLNNMYVFTLTSIFHSYKINGMNLLFSLYARKWLFVLLYFWFGIVRIVGKTIGLRLCI